MHLDWIQCGPWRSPDEEGYGVSAAWIDSVNLCTSALNLTLPIADRGLTNAWNDSGMADCKLSVRLG